MAEWYCRLVVQGHVSACLTEIQGCQRFLNMLIEARKPHSDYVYDPDHVLDVCEFIETLPHVKGFHGTIVLEPVQCWWLAGIFGFRERETGLRWTREASLWIPRKNGKTALAAGVLIYCCNFEDEPGAEACIAAGSEKQADIPFGAIRATLDKNEELKKDLLASHTTEKITFRYTGADIKLLAGRAPNLDGLNPHVVLAEEVHAQHQEVIGVLRTAQGARLQPLWLGISTAGRTTAGPAFEQWRSDQQVLGGHIRSDRVFIAMYAPDRDDQNDKFTKRVVEKLNPLFGISLNPVSIEAEEREARKSEPKLQEYLRTRLNIWARAAGNLFSVERWDACADPRLSLDLFKGLPIFVGLDLASSSDLNAAAFMVEAGGILHVVFRFFMPEGSSRFDDDRYAGQFMEWARKGHLILTKGSKVDHPVMLKNILDMIEGHEVLGIGCDRYQSDYLLGEVEKRRLPAYEIAKTAQNLSYATDDIIARHNDPTLFQHDGNPIASWMAGNTVGRYDEGGHVLPKKEKKDSKLSIDGIDAMLNANAARLKYEAGIMADLGKAAEVDPYLERGLIGY